MTDFHMSRISRSLQLRLSNIDRIFNIYLQFLTLQQILKAFFGDFLDIKNEEVLR